MDNARIKRAARTHGVPLKVFAGDPPDDVTDEIAALARTWMSRKRAGIDHPKPKPVPKTYSKHKPKPRKRRSRRNMQ